MSEAPLNLRCERKFLPGPADLETVLARLYRHPALFREVYPPRAVNNLYFDTPELRNYREHVQGCAHRFKLRLRWYGPLRGEIAQPVLECKVKHGQVSGKRAFPVTAFTHNGALPRAELLARLAAAPLPEPWRWRLAGQQPVLVNRYHRRYFASADGHLRLTLDTGLEFFDARNATGALRPAPGLAPRLILELKYAPEFAAEAAQAAGCLPFRLTRCSKYVLGIEHLPAT